MNRLALSVCALVLAACASAEPKGAEAWEELPPGWSRLARTPFTGEGAVSIWTGRELVHVVGVAAAYDPAAGSWSRLPRGPLSRRYGAAAVWTGKEILVWGGAWTERPKGDGAAFDPAARTWRTLPAAPLAPRVPAAFVWTGRELIVWGDASRTFTARDGAAYDPASDRWRELPPAPLALNLTTAAWTGTEMVVFGARLDGGNYSRTRYAQGIAYDPERNAWRVIAPSRLSPQASAIAWLGDELLAWDYLLQAALYDSAADTWTRLPNLPLDPSECYPKTARADGVVVAWYCGQGALFDAGEQRWKEIRRPPELIGAAPVAAGTAVLFVSKALWAYKR